MSDQENLKRLGEQVSKAIGGDLEKFRVIQEQLRGIDFVGHEPVLEQLHTPLIGSFGPSRREVWAMFAAAYGANRTSQGFPLGAPDAAGMADALLAEYDRRFPVDEDEDESPA